MIIIIVKNIDSKYRSKSSDYSLKAKIIKELRDEIPLNEKNQNETITTNLNTT